MGQALERTFQQDTDKLAEEFNSSIGIDCVLYRQDISGSIAHADMLEKPYHSIRRCS
jgi:argininosuccinate lyase